MKTEIHPEYAVSNVRCTCGNEFMTRSTKGDIHVEICLQLPSVTTLLLLIS